MDTSSACSAELRTRANELSPNRQTKCTPTDTHVKPTGPHAYAHTHASNLQRLGPWKTSTPSLAPSSAGRNNGRPTLEHNQNGTTRHRGPNGHRWSSKWAFATLGLACPAPRPRKSGPLAATGLAGGGKGTEQQPFHDQERHDRPHDVPRRSRSRADTGLTSARFDG
jgi:hypothetical protein